MKCSLGFYCETKPEMVLIPMKWLLRKLFFREALLPLILLLFLLHAFSLAATSAGDSVKNFFARPSSSLNSMFYLLFSPNHGYFTSLLRHIPSLFFWRDNSQERAGMERWGQSCRRRRWGVPQEEPLTYTGPLPVPASEDMGCGLRKLEDPEDSSPGKIYSTLKRPQVETKSDIVYEYVLLDFSLEGRNHGNEGLKLRKHSTLILFSHQLHTFQCKSGSETVVAVHNSNSNKCENFFFSQDNFHFAANC